MEINYRTAVNLKTLMAHYDLLMTVDSAEHADAAMSAGPAKRRVLNMLDAEQGICTVRTLTPYSICKALRATEYRFSEIPKKALEGTEIWVDPWSQVFPSAYRYTPYSTQFHAVYHRGSWWLVDVYRDVCKRPTKKHYCKLSESAAAALIASRTEW